ncbi:MAG: hypothetical protein P0S96_05705 [Simkaniaceae bacterium]|nr:hypothetical protein [Candidatus Sacchlamyda saccharinae]
MMCRYFLILLICFSVNTYSSDVENAEMYINDWLAQEKQKETDEKEQESEESSENETSGRAD